MFKINLSENIEKIIHEGKEYIFLCLSSTIYNNKGYQFIFDGDTDKQLALFRIKDRLYCLSNICPHMHQDKIFRGITDGVNITCPEHGWTYSLRTGMNVNPQQGIRSLKKFVPLEKNGKIYIEKPEFEIPKWKLNF